MAVNYKQVAAEVASIASAVSLALVSAENAFTAAHVSIPAPEAAIIITATSVIGTIIAVARQIAGPAVKSALTPKPKA